MAAEVSVTTDPVIVYGMVGLLLGAVVLALVFSRPRRGLGAVKRWDASGRAPAGEPWMPTGDIYGHDNRQPAGLTEAAALPAGAPVTPVTGQGGAPPPWDKR